MIKNDRILRLRLIFVFFLFPGFFSGIYSQTSDLDKYFPKINILQSNDPSPGYFFIATKKHFVDTVNYVTIVDNYGTPVYFRLVNNMAAGIRVDSGYIYMLEGPDKVYYKIDSFFHKIDTFNTKGYKLNGHDFDIDANGHYLLLGNKLRTVDMTAYGGVADATIKDLVVQEFDENKNLLYTWKAWEHYKITDANENSPYVDFTASTIDYLHASSLTFDSDTSFLLSCRHFDEITKIDRRTGEIIWRLGGKHNEFTFINDTIGFTHQHTIRKMDNGDILLFDNGNLHNSAFSSVAEYRLDEENKTATLVRRLYHNPEIFAMHGGGEQMLPDGDMLIYWGEESPSFTEYHPDGSVAIEMDYSGHNFSSRIAKSTWRNKVFVTATDTINYGMWDGYTESDYLLTLHNNTDSTLKITGFVVRTGNFYVKDNLPVEIPAQGDKDITVTFFPQDAQTGFLTDVLTIQADYPHLYLAQQVVLVGKKEDSQAPVVTIQPDTVNVPLNAVIQVDFSEPVRYIDGTELNYRNVDTLFVFNKDGTDGEPVPYNANVNTDKTCIEIIPADSLDKDRTYFVSLDGILEDYSGNKISPASVKFSTGSSISAVSVLRNHEYRIFPNPGSGLFTIYFGDEIPKVITVFSVNGKVVYSDKITNISSYRLDLSGQKPGIYFIRIWSGDQDVPDTMKVLLQK